jgi:hypothetical protein
MKFGFDHGGKKRDDRVTERASNWVVEWQSEWPSAWVAHCFSGRVIGSTYQVPEWPGDPIAKWVSSRVTKKKVARWLIDWVMEWLSGRVTSWLSDRVKLQRSISYLSIPFRYRPERPVCLVPACRPAQKELHPVPASIPADSGHLGRFRPFRVRQGVSSMPVPSLSRKTLGLTTRFCAPAPADAERPMLHPPAWLVGVFLRRSASASGRVLRGHGARLCPAWAPALAGIRGLHHGWLVVESLLLF